MKLLENLQRTIHEIFEFYKHEARQYYTFSIVFTIVSAVAFVCLAFGIWKGYTEVLPGELISSDEWDAMALYNPSLLALLSGFQVIAIALFGIFIFENRKRQIHQINWNSFFQKITPDTWSYTLLIVLAQSGLFLLFDYLGRSEARETDALNSLSYLFSSNQTTFWGWMLSLLNELVLLLPFGSGFLIVRRHLTRSTLDESPTTNWNSFLSLLLITIVIQMCFNGTMSVINTYLIFPISVNSTSVVVSIALTVLSTITAVAYLAPAMSVAFFAAFGNERGEADDWEMDELKDSEASVS